MSEAVLADERFTDSPNEDGQTASTDEKDPFFMKARLMREGMSDAEASAAVLKAFGVDIRGIIDHRIQCSETRSTRYGFAN